MTTLVGIQGDGYAVVGADTQITSFDNSGNPYQISNLASGSAKIATNGKYILGAAGDMRAINLLHHAFAPPAPPQEARGKKLDSFITAKFIPALTECFDTYGYSVPDGKDNKDHSSEQNSTIIVVVNATIYLIENDYSWTSEASGMYAAGSGAPYALGALSVLSPKKGMNLQQAKAALLKALWTAAKLDPNTGSPFHTLSQETGTTEKVVPIKSAPARPKTTRKK